MTIRAPQPHDRDGWEALWKGYTNSYKVDASATTENTWQRLLEPDQNGPYCLVYEDETGSIVGLAHYLFHAQTLMPDPKCYLNDLFTAPSARGNGVGRALIEAVYAKADERNCSQVYWLTQSFNAAGRRLYDQVGNLTAFLKYQR